MGVTNHLLNGMILPVMIVFTSCQREGNNYVDRSLRFQAFKRDLKLWRLDEEVDIIHLEPETSYLSYIWPNGIIFHTNLDLDFPEIYKVISLPKRYLLGWKLVWGRYNDQIHGWFMCMIPKSFPYQK